jgi:hypothetical protein
LRLSKKKFSCGSLTQRDVERCQAVAYYASLNVESVKKELPAGLAQMQLSTIDHLNHFFFSIFLEYDGVVWSISME